MARVSLRSLGRSSLSAGFAELWRVASRFFLTPLIIAQIGLEGYGTWTLLFSLAAYVSMVNVSFGLAYVKFTAECQRAEQWDRLSRILGSGMALVGSVAAVALLAGWLGGAPLMRVLQVPPEMIDDAAAGLVIILTVLLLRMSLGCTLEVLSGLQRMDLFYKLNVLASAVDFAVAIPLLMMGMGVLGLAVAHLIGQVAGIGIAWILVRRHAPRLVLSPFRVSREGLRAVIHVGGRFQVLSILQTALAQGVKLLLSALLGVLWVGIYELADKLITLGSSAARAVVAPLMPAFANLRAGGEHKRADQLFFQASKLLTLVAATSLAFLALYADRILIMWTGEPVPDAAMAIRIIAGGEILTLMTGTSSSSLRAQGKVRLELFYALIGSVTVVVVIAPLFLWLGFTGVMMTRVVAAAIGSTWFLTAYCRFAELPLRRFLAGAGVARVLVVVAAASAAGLGLGEIMPSLPGDMRPRVAALLELGLLAAPYVAVVAVGAWTWVLGPDERAFIADKVRRRLNRGRGEPAESASSAESAEPPEPE